MYIIRLILLGLVLSYTYKSNINNKKNSILFCSKKSTMYHLNFKVIQRQKFFHLSDIVLVNPGENNLS